MTAQRIPILLYHSVMRSPDPRFAEWAVTPELFAAHMDYLANSGYRSVTVRELVERTFEGGSPLDPRSVAITFDDGLEDFYTTAWPSLRRNGLTATVFIATGHVGRTSTWLTAQGEGDRPMLSWSQIREISSAGIECGAHSHSHLQLDTIPAGTAWFEISRSKQSLEEVIGPVTSFAYPHGYYTNRLKRQVERAGLASACAVKNALSTANDDRFALSRLIVRGETDPEAFGQMLRGQGVRAARRGGTLRRGAWRTLRRAGGEPLADRLQRLG